MKTFSLSEVASDLCGDDLKDPVRWLTTQIRNKRIRARKIGRSWRMTQDDINDALKVFASEPDQAAVVDQAQQPGLTSLSLRRRGAA